jgi:beta-phosphoglucomutase
MKKAICFDLDGVLVDACEWHRVALNDALLEYTGRSISLEDHYKTYNGLPTLKKLELLGFSDSSLCQKINDRKQELTMELIKNLTIDQEKVRLLSYLKEQGFKIACVTNSVRATTELMLKKTGQFDFFDCIITNQDIKNSKPNSEGYIKAMVTLQSLPENTWIVEDSEKGIIAAKNTGANVILVNNATEVTTENITKYL